MNARPTLVRLALVALTLHSSVLGSFAQAPPTNSLTLADAHKIIAAAQATATGMNLRVSIAVVDARGDLIAVARMPGAGAATPDTAIGKAMLSATFGRPSAALTQLANAPYVQAFNDASGGKLRFFQGAVPIVRNGVTVGAVGASGATSQQDEEIAKSGLVSVL